MRIKQKDENYAKNPCVQESSIYSKNPRFKIQKLLRSRMNQLNTKCLLMKSFESLTPQSKTNPNINQFDAHSGYKKNHRYSEPIGNNHDNNKRTQKTQFSNNTQTIDVIKQQISKTLSKDLLSLKNNVNQPILTMKTRNSLKIKLFPNKRRSWTINYNECCSLAQSKCQQQLLLKPHKQSLNITPKLCIYEGKNKTIAPLIYFLKKKQISQRCLQPLQIPQRIVRKKMRNIYNSPENKYQYHSQRTRGKNMEELRESVYSPWEMGERDGSGTEISDIFY